MTFIALVWPDGRLFAVRDTDVDTEIMIDMHCPYDDIENAVKKQIEVDINDLKNMS